MKERYNIFMRTVILILLFPVGIAFHGILTDDSKLGLGAYGGGIILCIAGGIVAALVGIRILLWYAGKVNSSAGTKLEDN